MGFQLRDTVGTNNHILHFCSAPFGRSVLIIQDGTPSEVQAHPIECDQDPEDVHKCIVQDNTISLVYPEAEYVTCYSSDVEIEADEYYTVSLDALYEDPLGVTLAIDHYFAAKSQELFSDKFAEIRAMNNFIVKLREAQEEANDLSVKIEAMFKQMQSIRDKSLSLLQNGQAEQVIPLNTELRDLLASTEDIAETYHILVERIGRL
ncbi:Hypothetical protein POVR2_LOCUS378 [uncultured virus]|nr:Hypothetical protein POVR2_LOCUS378 [uncultured virus]